METMSTENAAPVAENVGHTPGPWRSNSWGGISESLDHPDDENQLCWPDFNEEHGDTIQWANPADYALAIAAPELLAALREYVAAEVAEADITAMRIDEENGELEEDEEYDADLHAEAVARLMTARRAAEAAIAKAEGR